MSKSNSRQPSTRVRERATANQPFSINSVKKNARIRDAVKVDSICPYCAVGCSQLIYVKGGTIIDIEGNPESPINVGKLCPQGANTFQLSVNPHRVKHVMYRAPFSDKWERRSLDWAMDRIAQLTKEAREEGFVETRDGAIVNNVTNMMSLGGATMDIEENYLIKKLLNGGLGIIPIENQARI
ncbi:MAG: dehydrogenase [Bryobacterales bacterium]|nr:dehydrogenase [Bryobacterales bacterium]